LFDYPSEHNRSRSSNVLVSLLVLCKWNNCKKIWLKEQKNPQKVCLRHERAYLQIIWIYSVTWTIFLLLWQFVNTWISVSNSYCMFICCFQLILISS
jgi:hypothetical protein